MRQIKFRAWDGQNIVYPDSSGFYVVRVFGFDTPVYLKVGDILNTNGITPMQFTCLYDKNGKEIWEGDIVSFNRIKSRTFSYSGGFHESNETISYKGVIKQDKGAFIIAQSEAYPLTRPLYNWATRYVEEFRHCVLWELHCYHERIGSEQSLVYEGLEVIGNIYEHPNLLK